MAKKNFLPQWCTQKQMSSTITSSLEEAKHFYSQKQAMYLYGNLPAFSLINPQETKEDICILLAASGDLRYVLETIHKTQQARNGPNLSNIKHMPIHEPTCYHSS